MRILGVCRFSFFGKSDTKLDYTDEEKAQDNLYSEHRMNQRFYLFENLLLPSISAQTDKSFKLLLLSSERMPEGYRKRLAKLCDPVETIEVVFAKSSDIRQELRPHLRWASDAQSSDYLQFRIDDDDALACTYIEKLREAVSAWTPRKVITFPRGLLLRQNQSGKGIIEPCFRAYTGAGFAYHSPADRLRSIFDFAHSNTRFSQRAMVDPTFYAYVQCFHSGADTIRRQEKRISSVSLVESRTHRIEFNQKVLPDLLAESFPFLTREELQAVGQKMD